MTYKLLLNFKADMKSIRNESIYAQTNLYGRKRKLYTNIYIKLTLKWIIFYSIDKIIVTKLNLYQRFINLLC